MSNQYAFEKDGKCIVADESVMARCSHYAPPCATIREARQRLLDRLTSDIAKQEETLQRMRAALDKLNDQTSMLLIYLDEKGIINKTETAPIVRA
jgi:hypothetical protein